MDVIIDKFLLPFLWAVLAVVFVYAIVNGFSNTKESMEYDSAIGKVETLSLTEYKDKEKPDYNKYEKYTGDGKDFNALHEIVVGGKGFKRFASIDSKEENTDIKVASSFTTYYLLFGNSGDSGSRHAPKKPYVTLVYVNHDLEKYVLRDYQVTEETYDKVGKGDRLTKDSEMYKRIVQ